MAEERIVAGTSSASEEFENSIENSMDFTIEENLLMPVFKKTHISTRAIASYLDTGEIVNYSEVNNKRNALRQASALFRLIQGELFRHGSDREYKKYGLRMVVHDDEPQKKLDILAKCHVDEDGSHLGMNNTIKAVSELYYWQGVSAHVKLFLKKCGLCKVRSKMDTDTWLVEEKKMLSKKKERQTVCYEAKKELKNLGRIKKPTPPETFFIVNAERKVEMNKLTDESEMMIDSNNIEYVVETLGYSDEGCELPEVCHVFNVPDIVPIPNRFRSREIETFLKKGTYPDDFSSNQKSGLRGPAAQYTVIEDELYHEGNKKGSKGMRLVIHDDQPALKVKIMVESHLDEDGTHLGLNRTMTKVSEKYYWIGLSMDVRKFLLKCKVCMLTRGKKLNADCDQYANEVEALRSKHKEKHGDTDGEEQMYETYEEITEEVAQQDADKPADGYGHQIIRLVGPNEDVTEITVAVVNGDINTAGMTEEQYAALTAATNVETETAEGIVAGQVAQTEELVEQSKVKRETEAQQDVEQMNDSDDIVHIELEDNSEETDSERIENKIEEATAEETSIVEAAIGLIMNKTKGNDPANVTVAVVEDTDKEEKHLDCNTIGIGLDHQETNEDGTVGETVIKGSTAGAQKKTKSTITVSSTEYFSLYEGIIYVPKLPRTPAMQLYLESSTLSVGYTHTRMEEMTKNFFVEDGVLYRRPSRYKGRQIVISDDNAEMKLKIIKDSHVKANGKHFSEVLTLQIVQYKYYWEEVKWDVHRFYLKCSKCVRDGNDVKLKRRVLSVEEQKLQENRARRRITDTGVSALRNREFRTRHADKLERFRLWSKYGKEEGEYYQELEAAMDEIVEEEEAMEENLDGTMAPAIPAATVKQPGGIKQEPQPEDESDIEINMPGSDEETDKATSKSRSTTAGVAVQQQHDAPQQPQLYRLVVCATLEQEDAMRALFMDEGWHYQLHGIDRYLDDLEQNAGDGGDARTNVLYQMTLQVRRDQEEALRKMFTAKHWPYSLQELEPVKAISVLTSTPLAESDKTTSKKVASSALSRDEGKVTPVVTRSAIPKPEAKSRPQRMTILVDPEWEENTTPTGRKRSLESDTPVEGRRSSRREIKRPRRYSPDAEEETVKVKLETEFTPRHRGKHEAAKPGSSRELADTSKRQTSSAMRSDNIKAKDSAPRKLDKYVEEDDEDDDDDDDDDGDKNIDIFDDDEWPESKMDIKNMTKKGSIKVCDLCNRVFKRSQESEYEEHRCQHARDMATFPCTSCLNVFLDSQCQQIHERVHSKEKHDSCAVCSQDFQTSFQMASHMYREHGESNLFSCDICKAKFVNVKFLKAEMLIDGELSFFRCVMCRK